MTEETPSFDQRIEPGSFIHKPHPWPASAKNDTIDAAAVAEQTIAAFNHALSEKNYEGLVNLFVEDGFWRDHVAASWHLRTLKGRDGILAFLKQQCHLTKVEIDSSSNFRKPQSVNFAPTGDVRGIYFFTRITTQFGAGRGMVRIVDTGSEYKIWTFFTLLEGLTGHEEPVGPRRINGVEHGGQPGRKNWLERRGGAADFADSEPDVLIIGAGQGGLTAHARLKMLGVSTLVVDSNNAIGDNWRKRYHQLVLHDPVWYDHMPYIPFPEFWPVFTPKDKLADWFDSYAKFLELNIWMKSELLSSSWDDASRLWTVTIKRTRPDGQVETRTLHPKHIIQATGASGVKKMPTIPGMDTFQGSLLCHSADFPGAKESATPKKVVIIGACNSSHDIAQDYYEHGHSVTMVQRSTTCVISSEALLKVNLGDLYKEGSPPVEDADIYSWSWPSDITKTVHVELASIQRKFDADLLSGLSRAGFGLDNGPDNAGLSIKYFQRGGGYYIDVGTSKLIIDGKISVKHGQEVDSILPHGVRFADGTELEADEIIFATGYANMRTQTRVIFGDEIADRVGDVWGWDEEGEMRTIWRDSGHPGFWFHGGNLAMCRYYSMVLALQIKAKLEGFS
ncbi:dimethylaniline monooxygenase (N-oxide forming) [Cercophora newfieldiana]|uniref:Dimethylaniline monooxygenase (N-oxide forming) n=1 Tax=Cercophora newfieldiana TaxID=92897 RepID=A0AA39YAZ3_9PEZI|nr:dimethylaniline monooxygenase (N-oxide forming) [Cercophora newfieldiana]